MSISQNQVNILSSDVHIFIRMNLKNVRCFIKYFFVKNLPPYINEQRF
jgi:hypothetical protein